MQVSTWPPEVTTFLRARVTGGPRAWCGRLGGSAEHPARIHVDKFRASHRGALQRRACGLSMNLRPGHLRVNYDGRPTAGISVRARWASHPRAAAGIAREIAKQSLRPVRFASLGTDGVRALIGSSELGVLCKDSLDECSETKGLRPGAVNLVAHSSALRAAAHARPRTFGGVPPAPQQFRTLLLPDPTIAARGHLARRSSRLRLPITLAPTSRAAWRIGGDSRLRNDSRQLPSEMSGFSSARSSTSRSFE